MKNDTVIHIAFADDHLSTRKGIIAFLEKIGGICVDIEAENGKDLIKQLKNVRTLPETVLLDISMKEMDGFDTIEVLKTKWPDLKVLVLTGSESELYLIRMIRKGANGYLLKSCHPVEIKQALIAIRETGNYYSDAATSKYFQKVKTGVVGLPDFTEMQLEFLRYCPTDLGFDQIADKMRTTEKALDSCKTRICDKLQLEDKHRTRVNLAMYAIHFGLFHPELIK